MRKNLQRVGSEIEGELSKSDVLESRRENISRSSVLSN